jgi:hypothetical protein
MKPTLLESVDDVLPRLQDLHHQATVERSHYYAGATLREVIDLLERVKLLSKLLPVQKVRRKP